MLRFFPETLLEQPVENVRVFLVTPSLFGTGTDKTRGGVTQVIPLMFNAVRSSRALAMETTYHSQYFLSWFLKGGMNTHCKNSRRRRAQKRSKRGGIKIPQKSLRGNSARKIPLWGNFSANHHPPPPTPVPGNLKIN